MGQLLTVDGRPSWYEQADAISEDPRVFVYATLGAARSDRSPGCEVAVSPGEEYADMPARGWRHVGVERVAGRPAHHVSCGTDELWIDVKTHLALRSRGVARDEEGQPIQGHPDRRGEEHRGGAAVRRAVRGGAARWCHAPRRDRLLLRAGPDLRRAAGARRHPAAREGEPGRPEDLEALVAAAVAAPEALGAFQVELQRADVPGPSVTHRVLSDGAGSYRREQGLASQPWATSLVRPNGD